MASLSALFLVCNAPISGKHTSVKSANLPRYKMSNAASEDMQILKSTTFYFPSIVENENLSNEKKYDIYKTSFTSISKMLGNVCVDR